MKLLESFCNSFELNSVKSSLSASAKDCDPVNQAPILGQFSPLLKQAIFRMHEVSFIKIWLVNNQKRLSQVSRSNSLQNAMQAFHRISTSFGIRLSHAFIFPKKTYMTPLGHGQKDLHVCECLRNKQRLEFFLEKCCCSFFCCYYL